jgi:lysophospholipase L1-like esterase
MRTISISTRKTSLTARSTQYRNFCLVVSGIMLVLAACTTTSTPSTRLGTDVPVRIMPMGDSITEGLCDAPENCNTPDVKSPSDGSGIAACSWALNYDNPKALGYRAFLRDKLIAKGFQATYVGSVSVVNGLAHEGHSAWTISDLDYCVQNADWLQKAQPQIILLHIGTNDGKSSETLDIMVADLNQLLKHIYDKLPATTEVIVAQVIPARKDVYRDTKDTSRVLLNDFLAPYNAKIPGVVDEIRASGKHVSYVNMSGVIQSDTDFDGMGLHPNKVASERMADVWLGKIVEILEQPH